MRSVAVIGAGPGGLVAARYLKSEGFEPVLFEQGARIGGQWSGDPGHSGVWPSLRTNTSRIMTAFSDLPHLPDSPTFPTNQAMGEYLERYAELFGLTPNVRLKTPVRELSRDANGGWIATSTDLVKFASAVFASTDPATTAPATTGKAAMNPLFPPEIVHQITEGTPANPTYACGWSVHPDGSVSHSGGFAGSNSFFVHTPSSLTWAILVNTHHFQSGMAEDLHKLSSEIAQNLPSSPAAQPSRR